MPRNYEIKFDFHCIECKIKLTEDNLIFSEYGKIRKLCKECYRVRKSVSKKRYQEKYPERIKDNYLQWKFGISIEEYTKLEETQNKVCAICKKECSTGRGLSVDHNHETNEVRGLLCHNCNVAIGLLQEDEDIIWNMMEYLKKTTWFKQEKIA